jgi:hypothetical protein
VCVDYHPVRSVLMGARQLWKTSSALAYLHSGKDTSQIIVHGDLKAVGVPTYL